MDFNHKEFETNSGDMIKKCCFFASVSQAAYLQSRDSVAWFCFKSFYLGPCGMTTEFCRNWYIISKTLVWCESLEAVRLQELRAKPVLELIPLLSFVAVSLTFLVGAS